MGESGIRDVFMNEAREILTNLESEVIRLEERQGDKEVIHLVFRYVHTLKGSSGIAGFKTVYEFTHKLESLLDRVRSGELQVDKVLTDVILNSLDWIRDEIFLESRDAKKAERLKATLIKRIQECLGIDLPAVKEPESGSASGGDETPVTGAAFDVFSQEGKKALKSERYLRVNATFRDTIFESGIDPLIIMEDLFSLGTTVVRNVDREKLPDLEMLNPERCYLSWDVVIRTEEPIEKFHDVFLFVKDDNEILIEDVTETFIESEGKVPLAYRSAKLGEILVEKGVLSESELEEVVEIQDSQKTKLGDLVVKKGYATSNEVEAALKEQEELKKKIELSTIRVDTGRLDNLLNLLGEIVIGQAGLTGLADEMTDELGFRLKNALYGLDRTTREFQEQIMSIRMIPIGPTFEQFRRFVRDSAQDNGKEIKLVIEGGDTELDKTVIERISDPLKHMIRNAIDHGIEHPAEREKTGKQAAGTITLRAYHQEGNIYIEIIDDGKGVDLERVRAKAIQLGMLGKDEDASRDKLLQFLFHPGFSTAQKVGDLSGRGVGMDVVKTNIESLRGIVEIRTENGKGTMMRIKMPLTLAIIDGMLVRIGQYIYIIPLLSIVESLQPKREEIKTVEGKGEVILVRGEYVSLVRMYDFFKVAADHVNPWEGLVVIVESGDDRVGLFIDDLLGQQQIVIKSLDTYITYSRAISGAAILGDGKVALIIDIHGLVEEIHNRQSGERSAKRAGERV